MTFLGLLTLVFITLKLCGVIAWSWWLVLSPVLLCVAGFLFFMFLALFLDILRQIRGE